MDGLPVSAAATWTYLGHVVDIDIHLHPLYTAKVPQPPALPQPMALRSGVAYVQIIHDEWFEHFDMPPVSENVGRPLLARKRWTGYR